MPPESETEFLTPKQAADYMKVSAATVYSMIRTRKIEPVRKGGRWLISRNALTRQFPPRPTATAGYVSVKEAATMMRKPAPTVYSHVQMGLFPALRIGGRWFINLKDIATHEGVWANSTIISTSNTRSAPLPTQHSSRHLAAFIAIILAIFSLPTFSYAVSPAPIAAAVAPKIDAQGVSLMRRDFADKLPDCPLINHRGEKVNFFSDLVKGRAVLISFYYTNCEGICPTTNARLSQLRKVLAPMFGRSLNILSISVDPERDTPEKIARYASMVTTDSPDPDVPDWQFLTGEAATIQSLRQFMGYVEPDPEIDSKPSSHSGVIIIGNQATGRWAAVPSAANMNQTVSLIQRIAGWTSDQRYAEARREVEAARSNQAQPAPSSQKVTNKDSSSSPPPPILSEVVPPFVLRERNGSEVNIRSLLGKVVVLGQLYTPCPHGSHAVIQAMLNLNQMLGKRTDFHQVCLADESQNIKPDFFKSYASALGIKESFPWWLAVAPHQTLAKFVHQRLGLREPKLLPVEERLSPLDLYENDLRLVLLDQQGRVRGRYEIFHPDPDASRAAFDRLTQDARALLN